MGTVFRQHNYLLVDYCDESRKMNVENVENERKNKLLNQLTELVVFRQYNLLA